MDTAQTAGEQPAEKNNDTFPKLLLGHARRRGSKPAMREKDYGIWQQWSWQELADEVQALANGLAAKGFRRGDKLAIVGDNRPHLYGAMAAAHCLGGVAVPMYQDSVAEEMIYVINDAEVRFAVVEDQEQVDKLIEIKDRCPGLELIVYRDPRGLRHYDQDYLFSYAAVQDAGREFAAAKPDYLSGEIAAGKGADIASMSYTSGTTGNPKGVVLTYDNLIITAANLSKFENLSADEEVLAYLPMAWIGDSIFSYAQHYATGFCVNCPESSDTVMHDLREIAPSYFFAPPRIWENLLTSVMIRIEDASWIKRRMFHHFMDRSPSGSERDILERRSRCSIVKSVCCYAVRSCTLVYGPLKDTCSVSAACSIAYTAGEAIGPGNLRVLPLPRHQHQAVVWLRRSRRCS